MITANDSISLSGMRKRKKTSETGAAVRSERQCKRRRALARLFAFAVCMLAGAVLACAEAGGSSIAAEVAFLSAMPPAFSCAAFIGSMGAYFYAQTLTAHAAEATALVIMLAVKLFSEALFGMKPDARAAAILSGVIYFLSGTAAAFLVKMSALLIAAIFFRAVLCAVVTYFIRYFSDGLAENGRIQVTGEKSIGTAALYVLLICSLCSVKTPFINISETAGVFVILAAAYQYGVSGAAVAGTLTSMGFMLYAPDGAYRTAVLLCCSGIASGMASKGGRLCTAAVYAFSALIFSAVSGMMNGFAPMMTDIVAAAAIFCLIPEKQYMKHIGAAVRKKSPSLGHYSDCMEFAAGAIRDVRVSVAEAAYRFESIEREHGENDISAQVCGKVCRQCRSSVFCCKGNEDRAGGLFGDAVCILRAKGFISEKELPKALEGCTKKAELTECFNKAYGAMQLERRFGSMTLQLQEITLEQLSATEDMLSFFSSSRTSPDDYDDNLSERVGEIISECGGLNASASVFFDTAGHIYISCFYKGLLSEKLSAVMRKISSVVERDLDEPEIISHEGCTRLCCHEQTVYAAEYALACCNGRESISGDSSGVFADGIGNVYFLISDGM